jgi:hypothetical protein
MACGELIRPGMDVYDSAARYVGMVVRVYPVPERFARGDAALGCFKVRRGPFPFFGPAPLLIPFDAIGAIDARGVTLTATRAEATNWAQGGGERG